MVSMYVIFVSNMQLYSLKLIKNNNNNKIIKIGLLIIIMDWAKQKEKHRALYN